MKSSQLLPLLLLLLASCVQTSLQSPKVLPAGTTSGGIHGGILVDTDGEDEEEPDAGIVVGTLRHGVAIGEIGANIGSLGAEGTFKAPLLDRDGDTHLSFITGAGLYLWLTPSASVGLLAGQEYGPLTAYAGYRQYGYVDPEWGAATSGNAIAGLRVQASPGVALSAELNYNLLGVGFDEENEADIGFPVVTFGIELGGSAPKATTAPGRPQARR